MLPVHVENVIKDLVEQLKVAKNLAEEVMSLNSKAGEIGEGKCKNMQAIAEMFLKDIK